MLEALTAENLAAQLVIARGEMPKLYALNFDKLDGLGRCPENGTHLCPECFGMWKPEHLARAITHVERGACDREHAEREYREVPFRPENLRAFIDIKDSEPKMPSLEEHTMWYAWDWRRYA